MTRCSSCSGDIAELVERQRALQVEKAVDSFPFVCPHCRGWFQMEVAGDGTAQLVLDERMGALRTPSLLDVMFEDAEIREGLLQNFEDAPDPATMTPEERKDEVAKILARGLLRAKGVLPSKEDHRHEWKPANMRHDICAECGEIREKPKPGLWKE